jgi:hypothetical protein
VSWKDETRFGTKEFERIRKVLEESGKITDYLKKIRKVSYEKLRREWE